MEEGCLLPCYRDHARLAFEKKIRLTYLYEGSACMHVCMYVYHVNAQYLENLKKVLDFGN